MDIGVIRFWEEWDKADELKKLKVVAKLKLYKTAKSCVKVKSGHALNTLINGYFVDLAEYIRSRKDKRIRVKK